MKTSILQIKGMQILTKENQRHIKGAAGGGGNFDTSKCGCDCAGNVTGPSYCQLMYACPQIYTC